MNNHFDLEARTGFRFFAEAFGALFLLFAATFFLREPWLRLAPGSTLRALAMLAPIVPVWLTRTSLLNSFTSNTSTVSVSPLPMM